MVAPNKMNIHNLIKAALLALIVTLTCAALAQGQQREEFVRPERLNGTYFYVNTVGNFDVGVSREDLELSFRQLLNVQAQTSGFKPHAIGTNRARRLAIYSLELNRDPNDRDETGLHLVEPAHIAACNINLSVESRDRSYDFGQIHYEQEELTITLSGTIVLMGTDGVQEKSVEVAELRQSCLVWKNFQMVDISSRSRAEPDRLSAVRKVFREFAKRCTGDLLQQ